jgi:hypothetical protein
VTVVTEAEQAVKLGLDDSHDDLVRPRHLSVIEGASGSAIAVKMRPTFRQLKPFVLGQ